MGSAVGSGALDGVGDGAGSAAIGSGAQARAAAYLEIRVGEARPLFGVGIDANIITASMKAVVSGLLRSEVAFAPAAQASVAATAQSQTVQG